MSEIALCDRMQMNWLELQDMPMPVVEDYRLVMAAEAEAQRIKESWSNR